MVFFCCDQCGESLKKNQVEKHKNRCRSQSYSCLDCQFRFTPTTYAQHIKCITENQKYGGKNYVEKTAKGETKQQAWISLVQGAIENVSDPSLKSLLQKIQDFDNIPRKEAKFINFLSNSFRIRDRMLCQNAWNAIAQQTEKLKKQEEDEKKAQAAETSNKGDKTEEKVVEQPIVEANKEAVEITFKWKSSIKRKLKEAGGEMKVKRLKKYVIADYEEAGGNLEQAGELFEEKLQKAGIKIDGKIAQLV